MAQRDIYHNTVIAALAKDGWRITDDPLVLKWGQKDLYIDLGAEELIAAEKSERQIAVEIKSFIGPSEVEDLKNALGAHNSVSRYFGQDTAATCLVFGDSRGGVLRAV